MKLSLLKHLLTLAAVVACADAAFAQELAATGNGDWAEPMFSELSHDFGNVGRGADVRHRIAVKNIYKETVRITNVGTTCGCTVPSKPTQDVLQTGETAYIEFQMNTVKFLREKTSNLDVTVSFEGGGTRVVRIPIKAYIRPDVIVEPGRAEFGTVDKGAGAEKTIRIAYAGQDDFRITGVKATNELVQTELKEVARQSGKVDYDLVVRVPADAGVGDIADRLVLTTNDERTPEVDVQVSAKVVADITVTPGTLSLGNLTAGVDKTMTVVVQGRKPFKIEKIECESQRDCFKVRLGKENRNVHIVPLTVTPPAEEGDFTETFYLTISGREEPVEFTAQGKIKAQTTDARE